MKVDVTTELKDFLDQFSGNPLNLKLDLKSKVEELFVDDGTELLYQDKSYSKESIDYLINDVMYEHEQSKEKSNRVLRAVVIGIITGAVCGFITYLSYL